MKSDPSTRENPVCLIRGGQTLLADRFVEEISTRFLGQSGSPDTVVFYADETPVGEVLSTVSTPSMFSPKKVVVLKRAETLDKSSLELVKQYCAAPCSHTCLILVSSDPAKPALKPEDGALVKQAEQDRRKVSERVLEEARAAGIEMKRPAAERLCELAGEDLAVIKNELVKLSEVYGAGARVGVREIDGALQKRTDRDTFELVNAIADGKKGEALSILSEMAFHNQTEPLLILSVVSSRIRNILRASCVREGAKGAPPEEQKKLIAKELKVKPGAAHFIWKQTASFPRGAAARAVTSLAEADKALKTSRSGGYDILTRMVVNLLG